jgi:hypothetical protein
MDMSGNTILIGPRVLRARSAQRKFLMLEVARTILMRLQAAIVVDQVEGISRTRPACRTKRRIQDYRTRNVDTLFSRIPERATYLHMPVATRKLPGRQQSTVDPEQFAALIVLRQSFCVWATRPLQNIGYRALLSARSFLNAGSCYSVVLQALMSPFAPFTGRRFRISAKSASKLATRFSNSRR